MWRGYHGDSGGDDGGDGIQGDEDASRLHKLLVNIWLRPSCAHEEEDSMMARLMTAVAVVMIKMRISMAEIPMPLD